LGEPCLQVGEAADRVDAARDRVVPFEDAFAGDDPLLLLGHGGRIDPAQLDERLGVAGGGLFAGQADRGVDRRLARAVRRRLVPEIIGERVDCGVEDLGDLVAVGERPFDDGRVAGELGRNFRARRNDDDRLRPAARPGRQGPGEIAQLAHGLRARHALEPGRDVPHDPGAALLAALGALADGSQRVADVLASERRPFAAEVTDALGGVPGAGDISGGGGRLDEVLFGAGLFPRHNPQERIARAQERRDVGRDGLTSGRLCHLRVLRWQGNHDCAKIHAIVIRAKV
jgi:hypothetical protein